MISCNSISSRSSSTVFSATTTISACLIYSFDWFEFFYFLKFVFKCLNYYKLLLLWLLLVLSSNNNKKKVKSRIYSLKIGGKLNASFYNIFLERERERCIYWVQITENSKIITTIEEIR